MADSGQQAPRHDRFPVRLILVFLALTVFYRLVSAHFDFLGNTAPLMALAFGGALLLGARCWWVCPALLLVSDLFLGLAKPGFGIGAYTVVSACVYTLVSFAGVRLEGLRRHWIVLWAGTLVASLFFYGVANTFSWTLSPEYAKTLAGWWQSQTTGLPHYSPPAWAFLRNALIADTIWCLLAGLLFYVRPSLHDGAPSRAGA